jgi:hypothetical protein
MSRSSAMAEGPDIVRRRPLGRIFRISMSGMKPIRDKWSPIEIPGLQEKTQNYPHQHGRHISVSNWSVAQQMFFCAMCTYALSGLRTNVLGLATVLDWDWCMIILSVACVGKIVPVYFAARHARLLHSDALSRGVLTNTRALMELIVLNVGHELGYIPQTVFHNDGVDGHRINLHDRSSHTGHLPSQRSVDSTWDRGLVKEIRVWTRESCETSLSWVGAPPAG